MLEYNGRVQSLRAWAKELGICSKGLIRRLRYTDDKEKIFRKRGSFEYNHTNERKVINYCGVDYSVMDFCVAYKLPVELVMSLIPYGYTGEEIMAEVDEMYEEISLDFNCEIW
jgi:DNA-binding Lrp family transcriptional regulator